MAETIRTHVIHETLDTAEAVIHRAAVLIRVDTAGIRIGIPVAILVTREIQMIGDQVLVITEHREVRAETTGTRVEMIAAHGGMTEVRVAMIVVLDVTTEVRVETIAAHVGTTEARAATIDEVTRVEAVKARGVAVPVTLVGTTEVRG